MIYYTVTMKHSEQTFERLSHMQYDLFCKGNLYGRNILSFGAIALGAINLNAWWGALLIAYGGYLASSKYASSNRTAHRLSKGIKDSGMEFPSSRFEFGSEGVSVIALPEKAEQNTKLLYSAVHRLGEDPDYFYIFRDQYGGYMIPKAALGKQEDDFRAFVEKKTGQFFQARVPPVIKLIRRLSSKR